MREVSKSEIEGGVLDVPIGHKCEFVVEKFISVHPFVERFQCSGKIWRIANLRLCDFGKFGAEGEQIWVLDRSDKSSKLVYDR
jgi:hypothetical protein